jgi:DNA-binding CsgD family transcriptional regulator
MVPGGTCSAPRRSCSRLGPRSFLTDRRIDCLYRLAGGKTVAETATILDISAQFGITGPLR